MSSLFAACTGRLLFGCRGSSGGQIDPTSLLVSRRVRSILSGADLARLQFRDVGFGRLGMGRSGAFVICGSHA